MDVFLPASLEEALEILAERPEAVPIAGGTDLMVALNFRRLRPEAMLDLTRLPELQEIRRGDDEVFLGAGVTYARIVRELPDVPTLAQASRTVGSPQIRTRGTVGGNLGTGSPAGDALPVLAVHDADIELAAAGGAAPIGAVARVPARSEADRPCARRADPRRALASDRRPAARSRRSGPATRWSSPSRACASCSTRGRARSAWRSARSRRPSCVRPRRRRFAAEALRRRGVVGRPSAAIGDDVGAGVRRARRAAAATPIDDVRGIARPTGDTR